MKSELLNRLSSETQNESNILVDIFKETNNIREIVEHLHEDILQLKKDIHIHEIPNWSMKEQNILRLTTENLIQAIMFTRIDRNTTISSRNE